MADRVGQRLDNYRLVRFLGRGSFGEVYLAEHIYRKTQVAVKVLPQLADEDLPEFLNEARTIRLKHPHIVQILDFGVEDRTPFIVMDYAPNGTLRKRYPKGTQLSLASIILYAGQVASALEYAHSEQVVHRDVKPENMLLGPNNEVWLSDFGIATIVHSSRSQSLQEMAGTVAYMAPEQLQGRARPASDQYALGIVVYEWLCGERPFKGSHIEIATQHMLTLPPPLHEKVPGLPSAIEQVILTALEKDPKKRFASVQSFANALEQAFRPAPPRPIAPISVQPPAPPPSMPASLERLAPAVAPLPVERISAPVPVPLQPTSAKPPAVPSAAATPPNVATSTPSKSVDTPKHRLSQIMGLAGLAGLSLARSKRNRSRLFYSILVSVIVILLALVGGGVYYLIQAANGQNIAQLLKQAQTQIDQAKGELSTNPGDALQHLATAQEELRDVQKNHPLSHAQTQQMSTLLATLKGDVRTAIDAYNAMPNTAIKVVPCDGTTAKIINDVSTSTHAQSIASVVGADKTTWLYALGQDANVYWLKGGASYSLQSSSLPATTHVLALAGDQSWLVGVQQQANQASPYSLTLYQPEASGNLKATSTVSVDPTFTKDGKTPFLLTAWGQNVYVVLVNPSAPNNALLLNYSLNNGKLSPAPKSLPVSSNIRGIVALPNQLFLLLADGSIASLPLTTSGQLPTGGQPLAVLVQQPIVPPLSSSDRSFTTDRPFTTDMTVPVPQQAQASQFLTIAGATALSAGLVNGREHLYVSDPGNHRLIDLVTAQRAPTSSSTPTGTTAAANVTVQLFQQEVSTSLLGQAKSLAVDPQAMFVSVLIQNSPATSSSFSLLSLATALQTHCMTQSS